jgi:hypothetical protein
MLSSFFEIRRRLEVVHEAVDSVSAAGRHKTCQDSQAKPHAKNAADTSGTRDKSKSEL